MLFVPTPAIDGSSGQRSLLRRTDPYPTGDDQWGYRNPGNVGRFKEYYPPGNRFQNDRRPGVRRRPVRPGAGTATQR